MVANVITTGVQVGQSGTPANNFTVRTLDDGSLRISRGNAGAETSDVLVIDSSGNFSTAPVLGVGQTWQNVTASRALSTTYTNSTGKPIQLGVTAYCNTGGNINLVTGGLTMQFVGGSATGGTFLGFCSAIIPNGATYSITGAPSTSIGTWMELR